MKVTSKKPKSSLVFLKEGIKGFKIHGSLLPSSKYLGERILRHVKMTEGIFVVEIGAGTGAFTDLILSRMPQNGRLLVVEINPKMVKHLRQKISDPRTVIIEADATDLPKHLESVGFGKPDYIISGIPIGNFSKEMRTSLLTAIHDSLGDDSVYLQFQYLLASFLPIKNIFNAKIVGYEYRNVPPAFIYYCKKKR